MITIDEVNAAWLDLMPPPPPASESAPAVQGEVLTDKEGAPRIVEVVRSFSYNMSLQHYGGPQYESVSLFCSQKSTCYEHEREDLSLALYSFCRLEVLKSRAEVAANLKRGKIGTGQ